MTSTISALRATASKEGIKIAQVRHFAHLIEAIHLSVLFLAEGGFQLDVARRHVVGLAPSDLLAALAQSL